MKVTRKRIDQAVKSLGSVSGYAVTKEEAIERGKDLYLHVEYSWDYGGYRLVGVKYLDGHGHTSVFGRSESCERLSGAAFLQYILGLTNGIIYATQSL